MSIQELLIDVLSLRQYNGALKSHRLRPKEACRSIRTTCERPMEEIVCLGTAHRHKRSRLTISSEAWRYSGPFTRFNRFKGSLPGLGIGAGAFGIYLVVDALFLKDDHAHGNDHTTAGH